MGFNSRSLKVTTDVLLDDKLLGVFNLEVLNYVESITFLRERSHITSSFRGGGQLVMTLFNFWIGKLPKLMTKEGGGQKGLFLDDVICERTLTRNYEAERIGPCRP